MYGSIKTESIIEKCEYIENMLSFFNKTQRHAKKITIDSDFPKKIKVQIFQKFLHTYLNVMSMSSSVRIQYKRLLIIALKKFHTENPIFGRKIIFKNIKKLYEYSNYISIYNRNLCVNSYIPPLDLIDVEKKCYFMGEYNNNFSIFTLDSAINNTPQKYLTNTDLNMLCLFKFDNNNHKSIENNYCIPELW